MGFHAIERFIEALFSSSRAAHLEGIAHRDFERNPGASIHSLLDLGEHAVAGIALAA